MIRNTFIRRTSLVGWFEDIVKETILRWFGYLQRRDVGCMVGRMLRNIINKIV